MKMLRESFMNHRELMTILSNPMVKKDDKQRLLKGSRRHSSESAVRKLYPSDRRETPRRMPPVHGNQLHQTLSKEQRITRVEFSAPVKLDLRTEAHLKAN